MIRSAWLGPQVFGSYSYTGVAVPRTGSTMRQACFHVILAGEQGGVALHRVAQQPLVGVHLVAVGVMARQQLDRRAGHLLAGLMTIVPSAIDTSGLSRKRK